VFCPGLLDDPEHRLAGPVLDDGLLVSEVVRRPPTVWARPQREQRVREQIVDRHVGQASDAVGKPGRDVSRAAEHLADRIGLDPEGVGERLPAANAIARELERGPRSARVAAPYP
jgi:hypothetical protein